MIRIYLHYLIPPICSIIISILRGFRGYIKLCKHNHVKGGEGCGRKIAILGNGPSLNDAITNHLEELINQECIVVNQFAMTDTFSKLKPSAYILADPAYVASIEQLSSDIREKVELLAAAIMKKVDWEMKLYLPVSGVNSYLVNSVKSNSNIRFVFFNNYGDPYLIPHGLLFYLWSKGIISHYSQTVLNTALGISIQMRYSEISLYGADTSWHENLEVDQETNKLYTKDKHFYGTQKIQLYDDTSKTIPSHLHTELKSIANAFQSYWVLSEYAKKQGCKVYNCSSYSCIDAFDRK